MGENDTIITSSNLGQRLGKMGSKRQNALLFGNKTIPLVCKITIGRDPNCDITISDKLTSRNHAVIQKIKNGFFISDLKSTNGTYLNGKKIEADKYVELKPGDTISIGKSQLVMN